MEATEAYRNVCVEVTDLPSGGLECDVDLLLQSMQDTAGKLVFIVNVLLQYY